MVMMIFFHDGKTIGIIATVIITVFLAFTLLIYQKIMIHLLTR
jgi:hypothetical protein